MKPLRTIPIFLALFVAIIASDSFAQDKPFKDDYIMHWPDASFWNECAGETILGDLDFRIIKRYNANGDLTFEHWSLAGGVLIGQVTGKVYQATGANIWKYDHNPSNGAQTYSEKWLIHAVAPGTQIKFYIMMHWTVNANGETTAVIDTDTWGNCK